MGPSSETEGLAMRFPPTLTYGRCPECCAEVLLEVRTGEPEKVYTCPNCLFWQDTADTFGIEVKP